MAIYEDNKFTVINNADLEKVARTYRLNLIAVLEAIEKLRTREGRDTNPKYLVCNQDEPYAEEVLNTILLGEERKK